MNKTPLLSNTGLVILMAMVCRVTGMLTCGSLPETFNHIRKGEIREHFQRMLSVNNDEMLIAEVAINHRHGLSYSSSQENHRTGYVYDFTAFRPAYPVYLHIALQTFYEDVFPGKPVTWHRTDPYFIGYAFLVHVISLVLFFFSLFYFRSAALQFLSPVWANVALLLYGLYPSVSFFVGNLVNYESVVTSLLIVDVALILKGLQKRLPVSGRIFLIASFLPSVLFRPQLLFIYLFLFGLYLIITAYGRRTSPAAFQSALLVVLLSGFLFLTANIPVLLKNNRLFGGWTLGTTGFPFSLGHNPFARGGWCGDCFVNPASPYYQYIRKEIPGYEQLDEYQKAINLQKLGWEWIMHNPVDEMMLSVRKVAIYFLPYNNDDNRFNPMNLMIHLGCIMYVLTGLLLLARRKFPSSRHWILAAPLAGSIFVTILFHVGYRWRYYAEPFMIIMTLIVLDGLRKWYLHGKSKALDKV